jgi:pyrimidine operon attenuation protein/uracil phosphoribosyltransferase
MVKEKKKILDNDQVEQILKRMAYQIYEQNYQADMIHLFGVAQNGLRLAQSIEKEISQISEIQTSCVLVDIDKSARSQPDLAHVALPEGKDLTIVVVDDVLNSGRTMIYALEPFLKLNLAKLQTCVLVNRAHKRFPVEVDYKGLELGTTIEEHIEVQLEKGNFSAYLY